MADFPVPLDNLIKYVQALHPDGGPLDRVSDAASVSAGLSEESDALLGHFVDQARRSGATWNEIGAAMGVTKQAAQKRFVPGRYGDFSHFTERARTTMASARLLAGDSDVSAAHLGSAALLDPAGIAAKVVGRAGLTPGQGYAAPGTAESGGEALKSAVRGALRLGHNYIGTEHLLLGVIDAGGPAGAALAAGLGLTSETAREHMKAEIAEVQAKRAEGRADASHAPLSGARPVS